jgi:(p)ppGpp synthase/HD superfamily hydrolase
MPTLEDAILMAVQAHRGQVDKAGRPYILHVLRVMLYLDSELEKIVGALHDVIEDTRYTLDDLRDMDYSEEILQALDCLTRRQAETYEQFVERIKANPLARRVKIADLEDNLDIRRFPVLTEKDLERLRKYWNAWFQLKNES